MIRPGLCGLLLSLTLPAGAEVLHTDPLTISAPRTPSAWLESPLPVSVIEPAEGSRNLEQLLAPVPGLLAFNSYNQAQGLRLSLRGFGARAGFGVRGLRVLVDGVPLTMPDGQTELDGIDPALINGISGEILSLQSLSDTQRDLEQRLTRQLQEQATTVSNLKLLVGIFLTAAMSLIVGLGGWWLRALLVGTPPPAP